MKIAILQIPPLHPWCRCTVFVEVDDEGDELTNEELEELEFMSNDIKQTKQKYNKIKNDLEDTNIPVLEDFLKMK